jgi:hypothetical protein
MTGMLLFTGYFILSFLMHKYGGQPRLYRIYSRWVKPENRKGLYMQEEINDLQGCVYANKGRANPTSKSQ